MITRRQIRAARAMLGLSVRDLAADAEVGRTTLHEIETGGTLSGRAATLDALQRSLERHGVQFGRDGWLRHSEDSPDLAATTLPPTVISTLTHTCRAGREARAWSRSDFASRVGVSPGLYGRIEDGMVAPSLAVLIQIGAVLHLSLDSLLGLTHTR